MSRALFVVFVICLCLPLVSCEPPSSAQAVETTASAAADESRDGRGWTLRSKHLLYGVPTPIDDRFVIGQGVRQVDGLSVLVREGFVVGHYDRHKVPAWVSYRWTEDDYRTSEAFKGKDPSFKQDPELPPYARAGTDYEYSRSGMQRGHMARDADMDAWGDDSVETAAYMSNIVPQSADLNPQEWLQLENAHRSVVANPASGIEAVWVIAGPVFDEEPIPSIGNDIGVPGATYKLVAWFDRSNRFHARAYIMPQDADGKPEDFLVSVDEVEERTGLDFFSDLEDRVENPVEAAWHVAMW